MEIHGVSIPAAPPGSGFTWLDLSTRLTGLLVQQGSPGPGSATGQVVAFDLKMGGGLESAAEPLAAEQLPETMASSHRSVCGRMWQGRPAHIS